jgi:putative thiamine transport system permease protein
MQVSLIWIHLDGTLVAVIWSHLVFVVPYMLIALADPWFSLDRRYARAAASLGASPWRILIRIKLPILLRPLLIAAAIGFSVSVAQYLPTLFTGSGRVPTLTTEAVTLASGADRRITGVLAFLQTILPLLVYAGALFVPGRIYAKRRGLLGQA